MSTNFLLKNIVLLMGLLILIFIIFSIIFIIYMNNNLKLFKSTLLSIENVLKNKRDFDYVYNKKDTEIIDGLVQECIDNYRILNFEYQDNLYLNEDMINEMIREVLKATLTKLSPLLMNKLSYIYNTEIIEDIILEKVKMAVLNYSISVNGDYKE